jgi:PHD-finger
LSCDQCDRWFHGHCVAVNPTTAETEENEWKCPACCGQSIESIDLDLVHFYEKFDAVEEDDENCPDDEDPDGSSNSPDPAKLWPPFGFLGSPEATLALGEEVCAIPDCVDMDQDSSASCTSVVVNAISSVSSSGCKLFPLSRYVSDVASKVEVKSNVSSTVLISAVDNGDFDCTSAAMKYEPQRSVTVPQMPMILSNATVPLSSLPVDMDIENKIDTIDSNGVEPMECMNVAAPPVGAVVSQTLVPERD